MGTDNADNAAKALTWHEKEIVAALQRLLTARSRLEALEAQAGEVVTSGFDPEDVARLEEVHTELVEAREKASGRFGRRHADRVESLEMSERLILDRLGVATYEEYRAVRAERPRTEVELVDPVVLDFARREVDAAEAAFLELQSMEVVADEPEPDAAVDGGEEGGSAGHRTQSA